MSKSKKKFTKDNIGRVKRSPGVYKLYKKRAKKPTYIGESKDLHRRLLEHKSDEKYSKFEITHTKTDKMAKATERRLIKKYNPKRNIRLRTTA